MRPSIDSVKVRFAPDFSLVLLIGNQEFPCPTDDDIYWTLRSRWGKEEVRAYFVRFLGQSAGEFLKEMEEGDE